MNYFMLNAMSLSLAALMAVGIIVIGCFYLVSPERISGSFGLKPPASDADTRAWLRLKGIRDVVAGLVVLTMMLAADRRLVGIALLVAAIIPLGDMSIILGSGGSKSRAFSIHGVTCAVMLVVGPLLIHAIWEMPLTVLVDREGRIAISHAGVVDPLVFEADINALLAK
jgi:hypothetical protein